MGTLFSALDLGRAGMQVARVQLDTAGHNISNVNKEGFSRQRVELTTRLPNYRSYGAIGRGPAIEGIVRLRDVFLDEMYREQVQGLGKAETQAQYYTRIEDIFLEPSENGLSNRLNVFFDSLNDLANGPDELAVRVATLAEAEAVADTLNEVSQRLRSLRTEANEQVRNTIPEINSLAERIRDLNVAIQAVEVGGIHANDLRDDRDVLVDELASLVNIVTREDDKGNYTVLLGGEELVNGRRYRELEVTPDPTLDEKRDDFLAVQFVDSAQPVNITDGELAAALEIRDEQLLELEQRTDALAAGLIEQVNRIHSQGNGVTNISDALTSANPATSFLAELNAVGFPFEIEDGSFDIVVYDATGTAIETVSVPVDVTGATPTTMVDVRDAINASANLTMTLDLSGRVTLTPAAGASFTFSNDTAGFLTAVGFNGLFTGTDAETIAVNQDILDNPNQLSTGYSLDPLETGDNSAALDLAAVRNQAFLEDGTQTINEHYESTIVEVGINSRANLERLEVEQAFVADFDARRQEVSGVSLDEEVTSLILYQRAFEGAARVITVADSMLQTLINLVS